MALVTIRRNAERSGKELRKEARKQRKELGAKAQERAEELRRAAERQAKEVRRTAERQAKEVRGAAERQARDLGQRVSRGTKDARRRMSRGTRDTRRKVGYWVAGEEPPSTRRTGAAVAAGLAGAAAAFFLDPVSGKRRRHMARDRVLSLVRRGGERAGRAGRAAAAQTYGAVEKARHLGDEELPENDQVLQAKVESEVFQDQDLPKGSINVNAEEGVVVLRGTVERPELVNEIEGRVRGVYGVRDVENLLHLPDTPPRMHR